MLSRKRSHSDFLTMTMRTTTLPSVSKDDNHSASSSGASDHDCKRQKASDDRQGDHEIIRKEAVLPDPTIDVDPDVFLSQLVEALYGFVPKTKSGLNLEGSFFPSITEEQISAYDIKLVTACRENDVETVKSLCESGCSMDACNSFGESLLHMACRRGFQDMVQFFLDSNLSTRILDDCGRTPLHDAFWNPSPQVEIVQWIVEKDPALFFIKDKRGSTPFQYARPQDWPIWRQFLLAHSSSLKTLEKEFFS